MVLLMKIKNIVLGIIGIILIVMLSFLLANLIHSSNNKEQAKDEQEEPKFLINGEKVNFETYRVDGKFFINVPDILTSLDEATLKNEYNYNNRPELVFRSSDLKEQIFINTTNQDMLDEGLEEYLNNLIANLTNMEVIDSGVYQKYDKTFAKLISKNASTYYSFRYFTIDNKLVTIEFNVPVDISSEWEEVIEEVMDSICFSEDDIKKYSSD